MFFFYVCFFFFLCNREKVQNKSYSYVHFALWDIFKQ